MDIKVLILNTVSLISWNALFYDNDINVRFWDKQEREVYGLIVLGLCVKIKEVYCVD